MKKSSTEKPVQRYDLVRVKSQNDQLASVREIDMDATWKLSYEVLSFEGERHHVSKEDIVQVGLSESPILHYEIIEVVDNIPESEDTYAIRGQLGVVVGMDFDSDISAFGYWIRTQDGEAWYLLYSSIHGSGIVLDETTVFGEKFNSWSMPKTIEADKSTMRHTEIANVGPPPLRVNLQEVMSTTRKKTEM